MYLPFLLTTADTIDKISLAQLDTGMYLMILGGEQDVLCILFCPYNIAM